MTINEICTKENVGNFFLSNVGLIVKIENFEFEQTASIVGKLNENIDDYDYYDIMDWLGYEPSSLSYSSYVPTKNQFITEKYTYEFSLME